MKIIIIMQVLDIDTNLELFVGNLENFRISTVLFLNFSDLCLVFENLWQILIVHTQFVVRITVIWVGYLE